VGDLLVFLGACAIIVVEVAVGLKVAKWLDKRRSKK
jgi:hypothetical protein